MDHALPAAEKDTLLTMVADGEGAQVQALLLRRFRGSGQAPRVVRDQSGQQPDCGRQPRAARLNGRRPRNSGGVKNRPARPPPAAAYAGASTISRPRGNALGADRRRSRPRRPANTTGPWPCRDLRALPNAAAERPRSPSASWICAPSTRAGLACRIASTMRAAPALAPWWTTLEEDERLDPSRSRAGYRVAGRGCPAVHSLPRRG